MDELAVSSHFSLVELAAGWILVCPTERLITERRPTASDPVTVPGLVSRSDDPINSA